MIGSRKRLSWDFVDILNPVFYPFSVVWNSIWRFCWSRRRGLNPFTPMFLSGTCVIVSREKRKPGISTSNFVQCTLNLPPSGVPSPPPLQADFQLCCASITPPNMAGNSMSYSLPLYSRLHSTLPFSSPPFLFNFFMRIYCTADLKNANCRLSKYGN